MSIEKRPKPICPIPCERAEYVVTIDGKAYAGFVTRAYAEMAIQLWSGQVDGHGFPVAPGDRETHGWSAVRGRRFDIVEHR